MTPSADSLQSTTSERPSGGSQRRLFRASSRASLFSILSLLATALSGAVLARSLGDVGRGEVTAVLAMPSFVGWFFTLGALEAVTYWQARHPEQGRDLLTTWVVIAAAGFIASMAIAEFLVPVALAAQHREILTLGRVAAAFAGFRVFNDVFDGLLLGDHDFKFYNWTLLLPGVPTLIAYAALSYLGALTPGTAVAATVAFAVISIVVQGLRSLQRLGWGRFDRGLARKTTWYGIRAAGATAGRQVSARLDITLMPAVIGSAAIGLYTVATAASSVFVALASTVGSIVLPHAAREESQRVRGIMLTTYACLAVGFVLALGLALLAPLAIRFVYGQGFVAAQTSLRILLPGTVLYCGSTILWAGLFAQGFPQDVTVAQIAGAIATLVGLLAFLARDGIVGAAWVSTAAYSLVFGLSLLRFKRRSGLNWGRLLLLGVETKPAGGPVT